jgi:hypothetical protein
MACHRCAQLHAISGGADEPLRYNNTSYPAKVTAKLRDLYQRYAALKSAVPPSESKLHDVAWAQLLKYYQYIVREVMLDPAFGVGASDNGRGLLVAYEPGLGKTRVALAVMLALWDDWPAVLIVPNGLRDNLLHELRHVLSRLHPTDTSEALDARMRAAEKRFQFASLDAYNMADQVTRAGVGRSDATPAEAVGALDHKLIIIDEAHNFFRAVINSGSAKTNARRLHDMIMAARDPRVVFLTGTPISKNPFELVPCMNLLAGRELLPPHYDTFVRLYVDKTRRCVKNAGKLANRLTGLVSFAGANTPAAPVETKAGLAPPKNTTRQPGGLPEEFPPIIERVEMGEEQYTQYLSAREKERAEGAGGSGRGPSESRTPALSLPGAERKAAKSYHVRSRGLSNFAPARRWGHAPIDSLPDEAITESSAPKLFLIAERAKTLPGVDLIYSQFVESGLKVEARVLRLKGFQPWRPVDGGLDALVETESKEPADKPPAAPRYAIISGSVPREERDAILAAANSRENMRGAVIKTILVSKTGAEGLHVKYVRRVHQAEPYWDKARELQLRKRGARLGTHDDLPESERDVQSYLYIAVANPRAWNALPPALREKETIDEEFHTRASLQHEINTSFNALIGSVSIEAAVFGYPGCRRCVPSDAPLFHEDYELDTRLPDPCVAPRQSQVKARKLTVGDRTFFVAAERDGDDYRFYEPRDDLGSNAEVGPSDPMWPTLMKIMHASVPRDAPTK